MPLNRPALALGPGARGVQDARRWVARAVRGHRPSRARRVRRAGRLRAGHQRAAARRAADHGPGPRHRRAPAGRGPRLLGRGADPARAEPLDEPETDELLLTFGRGLSIVARCSDAWGAEIEDDGKVVWFAPAAEFAEDRRRPGRDHRQSTTAGAGPRRPGTGSGSTILGVPLALYVEFQQHFRELRREVRLLALAHEADYPLAKSLSDLFGSLDRQLRDGHRRRADRGGPRRRAGATTDLVVHMPRATARTLTRFVELLDLADEFCRAAAAAVPGPDRRAAAFQGWFLCEFVRQARASRRCRGPRPGPTATPTSSS